MFQASDVDEAEVSDEVADDEDANDEDELPEDDDRDLCPMCDVATYLEGGLDQYRFCMAYGGVGRATADDLEAAVGPGPCVPYI